MQPAKVLAMLCSGVVLGAAAQPAEKSEFIPLPAEAGPALPSTSRVIEEVVVTAQKSAQNLQEVPVSVSAISGGELRQAGNFDAGSLENSVPNVEIDIDPQAPVIGIRGFATETDNVGFEPAVGLAMDDLALARPEFIPDGLYDIERIEVLRGPQGTLFGKNTIAGVITFATTEPGPETHGRLMATLGDPRQGRFEFGQNLPQGSGLNSRLSGVYWRARGDVDNTKLDRIEAESEQLAVRYKLGADIGDLWHLKASIQQSDTEVDYPPWQLYDATDSVLAFNRNFDPAVEDLPLNARTSFNVAGFVDRSSRLTRVIADLKAKPAHLDKLVTTGIVGQAEFDLSTIIDIDVSPADIIITDFAVSYRQESLELRTAGDAGSLFGIGVGADFVVGVYGFQSQLSSRLDTLAGEDLGAFAASPAGAEALGGPDSGVAGPLLDLLPTSPGTPVDDQLLRRFTQQTESAALFGQLTWYLNSRWSLLAGLRLGREEKLGSFHVETVGPGIISGVVGAEDYDARERRSETDISPRLGIQLAASDSINGYFAWTRGFKGGGYNATAETNANLQFEPERAQSWELGIKSLIGDGALKLNATAYLTDIDQLQVVDFVNTSFRVSNAGAARLLGLEAELVWLPQWEWLTVTAALGVGQAEYRSYTNAQPTEAQGDAGQETQDLSGRTLPNAPQVSLAVSPSIRLPLPFGPDLALQWSLDASLRGDQYSATDLDPHSFQQAHWLIGSRLVLGPANARWAVILNGSNLTNERALDLVMDHSVYDNTWIDQQIDLRRLKLSFQANW